MNEKIDRIKEKISEIEKYLNYVKGITPKSFEEYSCDLKTKAACEHYIEKIIEASIDLAFLVINEKNFEMPEDEETAFDILFRNKVISSDLAMHLRRDKGMRNIIAHEYGEVDDAKVYIYLTEEIESHISEYLKKISDFMGAD